ncbi:FecR family protein [Sodalis sp. RH20]|uniref:FecR family protein n=2 Tax=Sodalis TaxID=84565 RepID=UPI0039B5421B
MAVMNSAIGKHLSADEQAARWLSKKQSGMSASEQRQFADWLLLDENAARYQAMQSLWQRIGDLPQENVARLRDSLPWNIRETSRGTFWRPGLVAAVLCLVLVWPLWQWLAPPVMTTAFHTGRGETKQLTLPDGTVLSLDAETQVQVAYYPQRREVTLVKGQVFFQVNHQQDKPFVVLSGPSRVTVLGTSFGIRYIPQSMSGDGVDVAVSSGVVRVGPRAWLDNMRWRAMATLHLGADEPHLMVLRATQRATSDANGSLTRQLPLEPDAIADWRQSRINFNNTPLSLALAEFSRYGDVPYKPASADVAALRISGSFNTHRPDSFARALPKVLPVKINIQAGETQILKR